MNEQYLDLLEKIDVYDEDNTVWQELSSAEKDGLIEFLINDNITNSEAGSFAAYIIIEQYVDEKNDNEITVKIMENLLPKAEINLNRMQKYFSNDDRRKTGINDYLTIFNIIKKYYKEMLLNNKINGASGLMREIARIAYFPLKSDMMFENCYDYLYSLLGYFESFVEECDLSEEESEICKEIYLRDEDIQIPINLIDGSLIKRKYESDLPQFEEILDAIINGIHFEEDVMKSSLDEDILSAVLKIFNDMSKSPQKTDLKDIREKTIIILGIYANQDFIRRNNKLISDIIKPKLKELENKLEKRSKENAEYYRRTKWHLFKVKVKKFMRNIFVDEDDALYQNMTDNVDSLGTLTNNLSNSMAEEYLFNRVYLHRYIEKRLEEKQKNV